MKHQTITADPLLTFAASILQDVARATGEFNPERQAMWTKAAQHALDGDTDDLEFMEDEQAAYERWGEYAYACQCRGREPVDYEFWRAREVSGSLNRQVAEARSEMGEAEWQRRNREWGA